MIKLYVLLFQMIFLISATLASTIHEEVPEGFAKVRIWDTDIRNLEAGHVSLQTKNAYISFWPLTSDSSSTNFVVPMIKTDQETRALTRQAPGFSVRDFSVDLTLEKGNHPNHIYFINVNNKEIEETWNFIKSTFGNEQEYGTKFESFRWYAPGRSDLGLNDTAENFLYFNCASITMLALVVGGLDERYINSLLSEKELWAEGTKLLGNVLTNSGQTQESKQIGIFLNTNHKLAASIMPRDIKTILDKKIISELEIDLRVHIREDKVLQNCDRGLAYTKMAESLAEKKSQLYKIKNKEDFNEFIKEVGYFTYNGKFWIAQKVIDEVNKIQNRRTVALIGGGVLLGTYALSEVSKGNCSIM
jgi:hypothetical protein